jgi:hypothetical protein
MSAWTSLSPAQRKFALDGLTKAAEQAEKYAAHYTGGVSAQHIEMARSFRAASEALRELTGDAPEKSPFLQFVDGLFDGVLRNVAGVQPSSAPPPPPPKAKLLTDGRTRPRRKRK